MNTSAVTTALPVGQALPDWTGAEHPPLAPMTGRWCSLQPLDTVAHTRPLYDAFATATDARDWTYLPYGPFDDAASFARWLGAFASSDDPQFHTIFDARQPTEVAEEPRALGLASYLRIQPTPGVIEVGHIHFSAAVQRTPLATEAMYLMMRRVFDELGYRRYEWKCDALNARSRAAALRLGFTFEGVFRQATVYKGRNRDTAWYSIVDNEWPAIREAFERWLSADNFDANGQQRSALAGCRD